MSEEYEKIMAIRAELIGNTAKNTVDCVVYMLTYILTELTRIRILLEAKKE
jgi:hypothetical protein